jgi:hypothetical protein
VVGYGSSYSGLEIFIWDKINGKRLLKKVLKEDYGLDLSGWILREPRAISADGLTIVGHGYNPDGYSEGWIVKLPEPAIEAGIDIDPNTLNLTSKGKWISCYIWLPEGYDVADVNSYSVFLEDEIGAEWIWVDEEEQVVMAKFSRQDLCRMLAELGELGDVELTVSGELTDGTIFEGTDTIRIISGNMEYLSVLLSYWLQAGCGPPDWCAGADLNQDTTVNLIDFALFDGSCIEVVRE